ncbi:MAG: regulatory protein RecX [Pseudomonadota bacterium]
MTHNELKQKALGLLARREHSYKELTWKLKRYVDDEAIIDAVVAELQQQNLQSDSRFAENFVHWRVSLGFGPQHISQDLAQRGVAGHIIAEVTKKYHDEWLMHAERVRQKRFGKLWPADAKMLAKQKRYLYQRGFSAEQISLIFKEFC